MSDKEFAVQPHSVFPLLMPGLVDGEYLSNLRCGETDHTPSEYILFAGAFTRLATEMLEMYHSRKREEADAAA